MEPDSTGQVLSPTSNSKDIAILVFGSIITILNFTHAISGPVEEFTTNDSGLGYDAAKPGETFIKIGVGVVRKPNEPQYRFSHTYEIVNAGKWKVKTARDHVEFTQELNDRSGYAYRYRKTVRLAKGKTRIDSGTQFKKHGTPAHRYECLRSQLFRDR